MRTWRALLTLMIALACVIPAHAQDATSPSVIVLLADDFSDPRVGVLPGTSPNPAVFTAGYINGAYEIDGVNLAQADVVPLPGIFSDSTIAIDAMLTGDTINRLIRLTCRQPGGTGDSGYRLLVNFGATTFSLDRVASGVHTMLVGATSFPAAGGAWTHLELGCVGSTITVAINEADVASVQDSTYSSGSSDIGIGGGAGIAEARFQNLAVSGPPGTPSVRVIHGVFGSPITFATHTQLQSYGFGFGPADTQFGAIPVGDGSYTFYGAAGNTSASACGGTPRAMNGAFTFTGTLDHVTGSNCTRLFGLGDGPAGWVFDRDYAGGGQVVRFASGGKSGWLMPFHSEVHWSNPASSDHKCRGITCFYSSIGLAVSTDDGKTFKVVGQIVQPSQPLAFFIGSGAIMSVGDGSLVVADANGQHLDNPPADPSSAFFYLFSGDLLPGSPGVCATHNCIGVARAPYAAVVAAALSGDPHQVATVFHKYDGASPDPWTQPATSDTPDESGTAGAYAPLWTDEAGGVPSVIYDSSLNVYLAVCLVNPSGKLLTAEVRTSSDLLHWSGPIATYSEPDRALYYPMLLGETGDPTIGGPAPRVYFTSFPAGGFPSWTNTVLESVPLTLSSSN